VRYYASENTMAFRPAMRARRASSRDHFGPVVTSPGERRIGGTPTQAGSNTLDAEVAEGVFIVEKCTGDFLRRDISVLCRCLPTDGVTGSTWSFEMKLKEVFYMLGMKPKRKIYGCDVVSINVAGFGDVDWALWQNPRARVRPRLGDLSVLSRVIEPGDFAIDVGAHVGDTSLVPALLAGPDGLVLSMEPNPATFGILAENAKLNPSLVNINAMQAAAMPEAGEYTFRYNDPSLMNGGYQRGISVFVHASHYKVPVHGVNLADSLRKDYADRLPKLKYIKTDLEGGDHNAFLTFRSIVAEHMPLVQAEMISHRSQSERHAQAQDFRDMGFDVMALGGETLESLEPLTDAHIEGGETLDILAVPPRYANVIVASE
jgi:FkbM family methyltransferase